MEAGRYLIDQILILHQVAHHIGLDLIHAFQTVNLQCQIVFTEACVSDREIVGVFIGKGFPVFHPEQTQCRQGFIHEDAQHLAEGRQASRRYAGKLIELAEFLCIFQASQNAVVKNHRHGCRWFVLHEGLIRMAGRANEVFRFDQQQTVSEVHVTEKSNDAAVGVDAGY